MRLAQAPRALACDTITALDAELAAALYAIGVRTVFRYLDRVEDTTRGSMGTNLTTVELQILVDAGLCVSPVQYYSTRYESQAAGRRLSADYGARIGGNAAANALALGVPHGATLWCDLEDVPEATPSQVIAHCTAWGHAVAMVGYECGLYYGAGLGSQATGYVTGDQLYSLPYFRSYWRAASVVPEVPTRGPCVIQGSEQTIRLGARELRVDYDMIALDYQYQADRARGDESPGRFMAICQ
jgi:hypothetical protein